MTESWALKVARARENLAELERSVEAISGVGRQTVRTRRERREDGSWVHYLDFGAHPDAVKMLSVMAGELLYNLRSALDHIAVSNVPPERKKIAEFPIFTDPVEGLDRNGEVSDLSRKHAQRWQKITAGMPAGVLELIREMQPFNAVKRGSDPDNDALALLHRLNNADKHRELNVVLWAASNPAARSKVSGHSFDYSTVLKDGVLADGARIAITQVEDEIEVTGGVEFALRDREYRVERSLLDCLRDLIDEVEAIVFGIEKIMA